MGWTEEHKVAALERTGWRCHVCHQPHDLAGYGVTWEMDHSVPLARGGHDHANNRYVACVSCNRSKGTRSSRSARLDHGYTRAPLPTDQRVQLAIGYGIIGGLISAIVGGVLRKDTTMWENAAPGACIGFAVGLDH